MKIDKLAAVEAALDWASRQGYTGSRQAADEYTKATANRYFEVVEGDSQSGFGLRFRDR